MPRPDRGSAADRDEGRGRHTDAQPSRPVQRALECAHRRAAVDLRPPRRGPDGQRGRARGQWPGILRGARSQGDSGHGQCARGRVAVRALQPHDDDHHDAAAAGHREGARHRDGGRLSARRHLRPRRQAAGQRLSPPAAVAAAESAGSPGVHRRFHRRAVTKKHGAIIAAPTAKYARKFGKVESVLPRPVTRMPLQGALILSPFYHAATMDWLTAADRSAGRIRARRGVAEFLEAPVTSSADRALIDRHWRNHGQSVCACRTRDHRRRPRQNRSIARCSTGS